MELDIEVSRQMVDDVVAVLNERLSGLTLVEIRRTLVVRLVTAPVIVRFWIV